MAKPTRAPAEICRISSISISVRLALWAGFDRATID
jgi:hypothetical protein